MPRGPSHRTGLVGHTSGSSGWYLQARQTAVARGLAGARKRLLRRWRRTTDLSPLCAAGRPSPSVRRQLGRPRPPKGCRRTRETVALVPRFSTCHPLRSTGVTRFQRYYEVIRLLHGLRAAISDSPTAQGGPLEISQGKTTRLPAAAAPNTVLSRLDTGRRARAHAHPARPACTGVHSRSVLRFATSFHPTPPHGFAHRIGPADTLDAGAAAFHVRFPPVGARRGLSPQSCGHAWRTRSSLCSSLRDLPQPRSGAASLAVAVATAAVNMRVCGLSERHWG